MDLQIKKLEIKLRHVEELEEVLEQEKEAVSVSVYMHTQNLFYFLSFYVLYINAQGCYFTV